MEVQTNINHAEQMEFLKHAKTIFPDVLLLLFSLKSITEI